MTDSYWREKERVLVPSLKVSAHQCLIAHKSSYFAQYFKELRKAAPKEQKVLTVDFGGQVCYEAFRKILDYIYLDDHQWLLDQSQTEASSSSEMIELIKLAKLYKLDALFLACEAHFKELMIASFDCSNLITLKSGGGGNGGGVAHLAKKNRRGGEKEEPQIVISGQQQ